MQTTEEFDPKVHPLYLIEKNMIENDSNHIILTDISAGLDYHSDHSVGAFESTFNAQMQRRQSIDIKRIQNDTIFSAVHQKDFETSFVPIFYGQMNCIFDVSVN